jgi:hypothetical protein
MNMDWMAGTYSPEMMAELNQQQALVEALRQTSSFNPNGIPQQQQLAQGGQQGGQSNGLVSGMGTMLGKGLNYGAGNIATANRYGTNIGSEQTGMLQAQDAGMF